MIKNSFCIFICFVLTLFAQTANACNKTITINFKNNITPHVFILKQPNRLVIDYNSSAKIISNINSFVDKSCISAVRSSYDHGNTRIVYNLSGLAKFTSKTIKTKSGYSLNINLNVDNPKYSKTSKPISMRDIVVVIDPGHGGFDPGAISSKGMKEKNITLAIAKKLAAKINSTPGIKAYLTRDNDKYIELRKRTEIAEAHKADIFISIHADSHPNSSAKGISVYALSESGATSEAARILADKENTLNMDNKKHSHHGYILQSVLIDLQQVATVHQSLNLGKKILQNVGLVAKRHSNQVEQAAFVVLKSPSIPSILIESGFVSNMKEAMRLASPKYQDQLANSFAKSITDYFKERKPRNTYFDDTLTKKYVKVLPGDTVKKIATKYSVLTKDIININNIKSDKIYIGQTLTLPQHK
jgi:N-acetylmuramoyl-L-alanine amidase